MRSIKGINTTAGMMSFTCAVICNPMSMYKVMSIFSQCGTTGVETAFVHMEDCKTGTFVLKIFGGNCDNNV